MKLQERYQLFEIIGKGGNSVVYRALDESLHIEVAIKCIAQAKEDKQTCPKGSKMYGKAVALGNSTYL